MSLVSVKSLQSLSSGSDTRPAQVRVRLKIPKHYRNDPILSTLVNQHQITIVILSALSCLRYLVCVILSALSCLRCWPPIAAKAAGLISKCRAPKDNSQRLFSTSTT